RLRKERVERETSKKRVVEILRFAQDEDLTAVPSNPHRHDDAEVALVVAVDRHADALRVLVLEVEPDFLAVDRAQEGIEIVGVDAQLELAAGVLTRHLL